MKNKNISKNVGFLLIAVFTILSTSVLATNIIPMRKSVVCVLSDRGNTLIADTFNNRVIEVDSNGTVVWEKDVDFPNDAERLADGNTLIAMSSGVIEVDSNGNVVWEKTGLDLPYDAERLDNGNTLIVDTFNNRVIEVDSNGTVVWEKDASFPTDAERLADGNTLIAMSSGVIEVDSNGNVVWEKTGLDYPYDAERLDNGNTLIVEWANFRVIEVDSNGNVVWEKMVSCQPTDAERLGNGNTLVTIIGPMFDSENCVIEIDSNGNVVWEKTGLDCPSDAERLNQPPYKPSNPNPEDGMSDVDFDADLSWTCDDPDEGDTLTYDVYFGTNPDPPLEKDGLTESSYDPGTMNCSTTYYWKIVAHDNHGAFTEGPVWSFTTLENGPPGVPKINGPSSGKVGETLSYTFVSEDPNEDDIYYEIDWGDGQVDPWDGPHDSNTVITKSHKWERQGTFIINARAKDVHEAVSEWSEFEITIPKTRTIVYSLKYLLLERFPLLERLLNLIR